MQKRFIAGASCPSCKEQDKLVVLMGSEPQVRECVACGYSDSLDHNGNIREITTRVNGVREGEPALVHQEDVQVLKLGD